MSGSRNYELGVGRPPRREVHVAKSPLELKSVFIRPTKGWLALNLSELWEYRELLYFLVWRDIKVRYKQTLLGFGWAIISPLMLTVVFTLVFGRLGKLPTDGLPKPVFYMAGLVIWRYFAQSLTSASNSLVGNAGMLTKIYFPRLLIPLGSILTGAVDLAIALVMLSVVMAYFQTVPALTTLLLPVLILMTAATTLGVGLFFAALNVRFRDVRSLLPLLVQLWMYITVIVPFSRIPERFGDWRYLYGLNPMAGVVEGFRWCLLHSVDGASMEPPWALLAVGAPVTLMILMAGLYYFRRVESQFADIV